MLLVQDQQELGLVGYAAKGAEQSPEH
jgi:hypothetical protein